MKLAFCIFKYFPYGGLQGDFLRIATECLRRGHEALVYTRSWEGTVPHGLEVRLIKAAGLTNHGKAVAFYKQLQHELNADRPDGIIGFNRLPGLDVYFAGDNCLAEKAATGRSWLYRKFSPRFKAYHQLEQAVFAPPSNTEILILTERQKADYMKHYSTPAQRFHLLPPGIPEDRRRLPDADRIRLKVRSEHDVAANEMVLIQVGSGFITKGVDRSIRAIAALPEEMRRRVKLWIVGKDNPRKFERLAGTLKVDDRTVFMGGRNDVPALLVAADLMLHPAINEAGGNVLLEAMTCGLPVLCTAACGYSTYIEQAKAGRALAEPFSQQTLNHELTVMLAGSLPVIGANGLEFAQKNNFYSRHIIASDIIETTIALHRRGP